MNVNVKRVKIVEGDFSKVQVQTTRNPINHYDYEIHDLAIARSSSSRAVTAAVWGYLNIYISITALAGGI